MPPDSSDDPASPEPPPGERDIFLAALQFTDDNERSAWLQEACGGDLALRKRIEALLAADRRDDDGFMEPEEVTLSGAIAGMIDRDDPQPGEQITYFGDYELLGEIARGAMGVVFRARQTSLNRIVAVKMIRSSMLASETDVSRFLNEAEAAAQFSHPAIVPIYEIGQHQDQHYFSMKLIEGGTLRDHMASLHGDRKAAVRLLMAVLEAVQTAHRHGVLHRDLKPGNILIDADGRPHVTDFGLAKLLGKESNLTYSGQIMGTPFYMAPEQASGTVHAITTAADIYSLGAVLYELLTGDPPFRGDTLLETLRQAREDPVVPPSKRLPDLDRDLETIVLKCLEKDPADRYQSALALKTDLRHWLLGEPISARPVSPAERVVKWVRRKPVHAGFWGILAVLLLTLGIAGPIVAVQQKRLTAEARISEADETRARNLAEERATTIRRNLYAAEMLLAGDALRASEGLGELRRLTSEWRPEPGRDDLRGWEWFYLRSEAIREQPSIKAHARSVTALQFNHAGTRVATASEDGTLAIWDSDFKACQLRIGPLGGALLCVAWSSDDQSLLCGGTHGVLAVVDAKSGNILKAFETPQRRDFQSVSWTPDGTQVLATERFGVRQWDPSSGKMHDYTETDSACFDLAWSPDQTMLATPIRCMVYESAETRWSLTGLEMIQYCVDWHPQGELIATGGRNQRIRIVQARDGQTVSVLRGHQHYVRDLAWSPDGSRLASVGDTTVRVWDPADGEVRHILRGHLVNTRSLAWHPEKAVLYSGDVSGIVKRWDLNEVGPARVLTAATEKISGLAWSPDGTALAVLSRTNPVRIWNPDTNTIEWTLPTAEGQFRSSVAWSPDNKRIAIGDWRRRIEIWEAGPEAARPMAILGPLGSKVHQLAFHPEHDQFFSFGYTDLAVWDLGNPKALYTKPYPGIEGTSNATLSPDGRLFAMRLPGGTCEIADAVTGDTRQVLGPIPGTGGLTWSPDSLQVAIADRNGRITVWNLAGGTPQTTFSSPVGNVPTLAWSPDGTRIASGGADGTVRIWNPVSGHCLLKLHAHRGRVLHVRWSPDGLRLATGGALDKTIKVWDTRPARREDVAER